MYHSLNNISFDKVSISWISFGIFSRVAWTDLHSKRIWNDYGDYRWFPASNLKMNERVYNVIASCFSKEKATNRTNLLFSTDSRFIQFMLHLTCKKKTAIRIAFHKILTNVIKTHTKVKCMNENEKYLNLCETK